MLGSVRECFLREYALVFAVFRRTPERLTELLADVRQVFLIMPAQHRRSIRLMTLYQGW